MKKRYPAEILLLLFYCFVYDAFGFLFAFHLIMKLIILWSTNKWRIRIFRLINIQEQNICHYVFLFCWIRKKGTFCQLIVDHNSCMTRKQKREQRISYYIFRLTSSANSKSPSNFLLHFTPMIKTRSIVAVNIHENRIAPTIALLFFFFFYS